MKQIFVGDPIDLYRVDKKDYPVTKIVRGVDSIGILVSTAEDSLMAEFHPWYQISRICVSMEGRKNESI